MKPIKWNVKSLVSIIILSFILSCGSNEPSDEELLRQDKESLAEVLDSDKVLFYKLCKIGIRSTGGESSSKNPKKIDEKNLRNTVKSLSTLIETRDPSSISLYEYYRIYRTYEQLKGFSREADEDTYPPMSYALLSILYGAYQQKLPQFEGKYKIALQNYEHAIFGISALRAPGLGGISLYEFNAIDVETVEDPPMKIYLGVLRSGIYFLEELPYLSEHQLSQLIEYTEKYPNPTITFPKELNPNNRTQPLILKTQEVTGYLHLVRGAVRHSMNRDLDQKRSKDDFYIALNLFEETNTSNELVQITKAYLAIDAERHEEAIKSLKKLRESDKLSLQIKTQIDASIDYLHKRDKESALNYFHDKAFIFSITYELFIDSTMNGKQEDIGEMLGVESAKEIQSFVDITSKVYEKSRLVKDIDDIDSLKNDAQKEGEKLWDKAKDLISN